MAGLVFGLKQGFGRTASLLVDDSGAGSGAKPRDPRIGEILSRLEEIEKSGRNQWVSPQDLSNAVTGARLEILTEVEERFENQKLSMQTLHALIGQTEQMLERVLEHLERRDGESEAQDASPDNISLNDITLANLALANLTPDKVALNGVRLDDRLLT